MGIGIGAKNATVPIYSSEMAPARIRGALVMFWQLWVVIGKSLLNLFLAAYYRCGLSFAATYYACTHYRPVLLTEIMKQVFLSASVRTSSLRMCRLLLGDLNWVLLLSLPFFSRSVSGFAPSLLAGL